MSIKDIKLKLEIRMKKMKQEVGALYFAYQSKKTPVHAKIVVAVVVGYALSPIDLIPDFIPVLGYLDDVILLPLGIALAIRLIPKEVMEESRAKAQEYFDKSKSRNWTAAILIVAMWIALIAFSATKIIEMMLDLGW